MLAILSMIMLSQPTLPREIDPGSWITDGDYPSSEVSHAVSGATRVELYVKKDGRVEDCRVIEASGSNTLDVTACALLKARARYAPARDANGRDVDMVVSKRVVWRLPDSAVGVLPPIPEVVAVAVDVSDKGVIENCAVVESSGKIEAGTPTPCARFVAGMRLRPATDAGGKPIGYRMVTRQTITFTPR